MTISVSNYKFFTEAISSISVYFIDIHAYMAFMFEEAQITCALS